MFDPKLFDDLARRISASTPDGLRGLQQDMERNLRAGVQAALDKLDLVTREEFDAQREVLTRTRAKLDEMSELVSRLETELHSRSKRDD